MNNPFQTIEDRLNIIEKKLDQIILNNEVSPEVKTEPVELLTIDQAADFLHLSRATIYSKCSHKQLPYMKRGKRLYFLKDQLLEFMKAGQRDVEN